MEHRQTKPVTALSGDLWAGRMTEGGPDVIREEKSQPGGIEIVNVVIFGSLLEPKPWVGLNSHHQGDKFAKQIEALYLSEHDRKLPRRRRRGRRQSWLGGRHSIASNLFFFSVRDREGEVWFLLSLSHLNHTKASKHYLPPPNFDLSPVSHSYFIKKLSMPAVLYSRSNAWNVSWLSPFPLLRRDSVKQKAMKTIDSHSGAHISAFWSSNPCICAVTTRHPSTPAQQGRVPREAVGKGSEASELALIRGIKMVKKEKYHVLPALGVTL